MTMTLPTPAELADIAQEELRLAMDPHGTGAVDLHDGARNTAFVSVQVGLAMRVVRYAADRDAASRASTAEGDDLDIVAHDDFGTDRKPEEFATGKVRLTRGASRPATVIPRGSRVAMPATPQTPAVVYAVSVTTPVLTNETAVVVPVVALEAGEAANIPDAATITQLVDPLPDDGWAIGTPEVGTVFGGGASAENDSILRSRLGQIGPADERGTRLAILAAALGVSGVRWAVAVEPFNGTVALYVGDANYALTDVMAARVRTALLGVRCFGVAVDLRTFAPIDVQVTASVYMGLSLDHYDLEALGRLGERYVLEYFAQRPQPDEYFRDRITGAIGRVHDEVQHVVLSTPSADVVRPADEDYTSIAALDRYRVLPGSVRLTFLPPLTT